MKVTLKRFAKKDTYTVGRLYVDGSYVCDTLEDKDRGLTSSMPLEEIRQKKVFGQTAIPTGTYKLSMKIYSDKFGAKSFYRDLCWGKVPRLLNVKGFSGILIHCGNTQRDTDGCILVGYNKAIGQVLNSQYAFKKLYNILKTCKDNITISIE